MVVGRVKRERNGIRIVINGYLGLRDGWGWGWLLVVVGVVIIDGVVIGGGYYY